MEKKWLELMGYLMNNGDSFTFKAATVVDESKLVVDYMSIGDVDKFQKTTVEMNLSGEFKINDNFIEKPLGAYMFIQNEILQKTFVNG